MGVLNIYSIDKPLKEPGACAKNAESMTPLQP